MEEESNRELAFPHSLLKRNNGKISVMAYGKPTHTDQYIRYSSHHQASCKESVASKDDLTKENARIKQVLKENGYQESIIRKIVKRITNNHKLSQSQQQTKATDIQDEEIRVRSHKIRSTFYTENTLRELLCKPKDRVATEDENNIFYEIDRNSYKAVYFDESK